MREGRLCGWTYCASDPGAVLDVTLRVPGGASRTVRADRLRADLRALGLADCYHGFSFPLAGLPGASRGAVCVWSDLGVDLPGSPWTPPRGGIRGVRVGSVRLALDPPLTGDPRLMGQAYDLSVPLRRLRLGCLWEGKVYSRTTASLYRRHRDGGDGFHGFILPLPAPRDELLGDLTIIDVDREQALATLEPRAH